MGSDKDILCDMKLEQLQRTIDDKILQEKKRSVSAREAKTSPTVYKIESEVVQIEKCYADALAEVAPGQDTMGLSALEYCTMCIYYDSQPYPIQFIEKIIEDENESEGPDGDDDSNSELDDVLDQLAEDMQ